jgi:hypothetical protein
MTDPRERLGGSDVDGAREVEITEGGELRDVQPPGSAGSPEVPAKPTKLSPHVFGLN